MKIRVKKDFLDKYTQEKYKEGQVLVVTEERGKEILSSKYDVAEEVKEPKPVKKPKAKKDSEE